jgi:hypothetical protein
MGKRHVLTFLGFCGFALSYAMRFNLSIAIVAMVKRNSSVIPIPIPSNFSSSNFSDINLNASPACPVPHKPINESQDGFSLLSFDESTEGEFDWDEVQQGIILGAFFWGYMVRAYEALCGSS